MSNIKYSLKDNIAGFKMTAKVLLYLSFWQSYEWLCVHTLEIVNSWKTHKIVRFARMEWNTNTKQPW